MKESDVAEIEASSTGTFFEIQFIQANNISHSGVHIMGFYFT